MLFIMFVTNSFILPKLAFYYRYMLHRTFMFQNYDHSSEMTLSFSMSRLRSMKQEIEIKLAISAIFKR